MHGNDSWWCGSILSLRHPHERGDPSYSERRGSFLALHYWCFCRFSYSVILANAGIHCIASAVAQFWRSIIGVAVGFLVIVCGGECVANTRLLPRVDEWIPVCTGMTAGWCRSILSLRHPRERGDPLYSEHRGLVLSHHYWCFC